MKRSKENTHYFRSPTPTVNGCNITPQTRTQTSEQEQLWWPVRGGSQHRQLPFTGANFAGLETENSIFEDARENRERTHLVSIKPECCNLSGGVALIVRFTTNGMCVKNNTIHMWREQAIIEWSRRVISIVACCHGAKLCAHAARDSDRNMKKRPLGRKFISDLSEKRFLYCETEMMQSWNKHCPCRCPSINLIFEAISSSIFQGSSRTTMTLRAVASGGAGGARPPISRLTHRLLHTSNTVF